MSEIYLKKKKNNYYIFCIELKIVNVQPFPDSLLKYNSC